MGERENVPDVVIDVESLCDVDVEPLIVSVVDSVDDLVSDSEIELDSETDGDNE